MERFAPRDRSAQPPLSRARTRQRSPRRVRSALSTAWRRSNRPIPSSSTRARRRSVSARTDGGEVRSGAAHHPDVVARQRQCPPTRCASSTSACAVPAARRKASSTSASPSWTAVAIEIVYVDGALAVARRAATARRGERPPSEDDPQRSARLQGHGTVPARLEVRGEIIFPRDAFAQLNPERVAAGESGVRQPAQRSRGVAAPARRAPDGSPTNRCFLHSAGAERE